MGDGAEGVREFKAGAPLTGAEKFRLLGEVFFLLAASKEHSNYSVAQVGQLVIEPIRRGQFRLYSRRGSPVGLVTWALLDEAASSHYGSGKSLRPDQLTSGGELWVLDYIAPFGDARGIADDLSRTSFASYQEAYAIKRYANGEVRRVKAFRRSKEATKDVSEGVA